MKRFLLILITICLLISLIGCEEKKMDKEEVSEDHLTVFVTIPPLKSLAERIGGEYCDVHVLLPPGAEPHSYEPTPEDIRRLTNSDLLFQIGMGFDEWATKIALAAENGPRIIPLAAGVPSLPALPERLRKRYRADEKVSAHGNPHVWMDPFITSELLLQEMIRGFAAAYPAISDTFWYRGHALKKELRNLDEKISLQLEDLKSRSVILHHGSMIYFCRRYGMIVLDILEPLPGYEPSPKDIQDIVELGKEKNAVCVMSEINISQKPAKVIGEELNIPVVIVDPLGDNETSYIELIEKNVKAIEGNVQ